MFNVTRVKAWWTVYIMMLFCGSMTPPQALELLKPFGKTNLLSSGYFMIVRNQVNPFKLIPLFTSLVHCCELIIQILLWCAGQTCWILACRPRTGHPIPVRRPCPHRFNSHCALLQREDTAWPASLLLSWDDPLQWAPASPPPTSNSLNQPKKRENPPSYHSGSCSQTRCKSNFRILCWHTPTQDHWKLGPNRIGLWLGCSTGSWVWSPISTAYI